MQVFVTLLLLTTPLACFALNIQKCPGVQADGKTDVTGPIQKCLMSSAGACGKVFFPTGQYMIAGTVTFDACGGQIDIAGEGDETLLIWGSSGDMFVWTEQAGVLGGSSVSSFKILASVAVKNPNATALRFTGGFTQSSVNEITVTSDDGAKIYPMNVLDLGVVTDTVSIINPLFQNVHGVGIKIGHGSEVRSIGGRIFGQFSGSGWVPGSAGMHVTGNNGGVHIISTDLIALETGLLLDNSSGAGSNREIFLSQATVDSNYRGLVIHDNSYVDFSGVWTASSGDANIYVGASAAPLVSLTGGTIFNAGTYGAIGNNDGIAWHGTGSFVLSGVTVRNNKGRGLWMTNPAMRNFIVSGSQFYGNGMNMDVVGDNYTITGCIFQPPLKTQNSFGPAHFAVVANNVGM
jgi:hypothetical protein